MAHWCRAVWEKKETVDFVYQMYDRMERLLRDKERLTDDKMRLIDITNDIFMENMRLYREYSREIGRMKRLLEENGIEVPETEQQKTES